MKIKPKKIYNTVMLCLFVLFVSLYIASETGYYEYQNKTKAQFTEEKIKQFEEDIRNGKEIDIKNYLAQDVKKYDNKVTKLGNALSEIVDGGIMNGIEKTFSAIEKLIE